MKVAIVLGTRPEIIKMSPVIKELEKKRIDYILIHTNQHYSYEMDRVFFNELNLQKPTVNLGIGSGSHGLQTGRMLENIEIVLKNEKPDVVLVQGDTNSVLAGALAAAKMNIPVGHVEAGLRSNDRTMPEEINRVVVDHISDFLFTPTIGALKNLVNEGISLDKIYLSGNTIIDAVNYWKPKKPVDYNLPKKYIFLTFHRPSNVDTKEAFENVLVGLSNIYKVHGLPFVLPIHPRTEKMLHQFNLKLPSCVQVIPPTGFFECLYLEKHAKLILTDSGGVQEEACALGVPSVTLRDNTERPETLEVGASILSGNDPAKMIAAVNIMIDKSNFKNPFGDGRAGQKIVLALETFLQKK